MKIVMPLFKLGCWDNVIVWGEGGGGKDHSCFVLGFSFKQTAQQIWLKSKYGWAFLDYVLYISVCGAIG